MLNAANRLRHSEDFRATVRRGQRRGRARVVVHLLTDLPFEPAPEGEVPLGAEVSALSGQPSVRVGFVVGRTVGSSVVRSTVQRRLRHLMRERLASLPPGSRVVVRATPAAAGASSADLGRDLDAALTRLAPSRAEAS